MAVIKFICCVVLIICSLQSISTSNSTTEMDYNDGITMNTINSDEILNGYSEEDSINSSNVKEIDIREMKSVKLNFNNKGIYSLSRILNFYDNQKLVDNWDTVKLLLSEQCKTDVNEYIEGLKRGETWAFKMDDSNGRYTTGFFWGNNYWTGSQTLCLSIAPETHTSSVQFKPIPNKSSKSVMKSDLNTNNSGNARIVRDAKLSDDIGKKTPGGDSTYAFGKYDDDGNLPPFAPTFYLFKIKVNTTRNITPRIRILHVGVCMPQTCTEQDVTRIVYAISEKSEAVSTDILNVKSRYQWYNMWEDSTFQVIFIAAILVGLLQIAGTSYDFYLVHCINKTKQKMLNCTTYEISSSQLDKSMNKSSMYVVNSITPVTTTTSVMVSGSDESLKEGTESEQNICPYTCGEVCSELLLSFSARINLKTIFDQSVGCDTIPTIHGLRAISMAWIVLGHTCLIAFKYADNMEYRRMIEQKFIFQTITNSTFSVDTFFFISGLLVSYLYFRTNAKGKLDPLTKGANKIQSGIVHFFGLIVYRFARLTTPYLFILGVNTVLMKWYFYNSVFEPPALEHETCPKYWWRNILYINTLFPVEQMCLVWSWYLSDDTQFYVIGVIMLIVAVSHFKVAAGLMILTLASSWFTTFYVAFSNNHMPNLDDPLALFDKIYDKPWTRLGPYFIGMSVGYLLYKTDCKIQMSKIVVGIGWILSSGILFSLVYGLYEANLTPIVAAAYSSLSHTVWALGLAWIVVACSTGYGGTVNRILSTPYLYPFSRVTYCAYLVHPLCMRFMIMKMDSPLHLGIELMATLYIGQIVLSYVLSFVISLAFEAPIVTMLRLLSPKSKKSIQ